MRVGLPLMKNVLTLLAKNVLLSLGVTTAATSATDAAIQKKILRLETTLIILNEEIDDIMKIVQSLEESRLLIMVLLKGVSETMKNEAKEQMGGFFWCVFRYIRC